MTGVKVSLKNSAVLRKMTRLAPEVGNTTRWTSWGNMMDKFQRMRTDLIAASEEEDGTVQLNTSAVFKRKAEKITGCFRDINVVAYSMQTRMYKLSQCRQDLDALLSEVGQGHSNAESNWYGHKLPGNYISRDSSKLPDPHFVSGIIKIQTNQLLQLTEEEKVACARVVNNNHN